MREVGEAIDEESSVFSAKDATEAAVAAAVKCNRATPISEGPSKWRHLT